PPPNPPPLPGPTPGPFPEPMPVPMPLPAEGTPSPARGFPKLGEEIFGSSGATIVGFIASLGSSLGRIGGTNDLGATLGSCPLVTSVFCGLPPPPLDCSGLGLG